MNMGKKKKKVKKNNYNKKKITEKRTREGIRTAGDNQRGVRKSSHKKIYIYV